MGNVNKSKNCFIAILFLPGRLVSEKPVHKLSSTVQRFFKKTVAVKRV